MDQKNTGSQSGAVRGVGGMTMSEQGREQNEGDRQKVREMRSGERT